VLGLSFLLAVGAGATACVTARVAPDSGSSIETERQVSSEDAPPLPLLRVTVMNLEFRVLPGANVELTAAGSHTTLRYKTGPEGWLTPDVGPGNWRITVSGSGYAPVSASLVVRTGEGLHVRVFLRLHADALMAALSPVPSWPAAPAR
jgi:hypothetical protein